MFGLDWGMSVEQVKAKGVKLKAVGRIKNTSVYAANSLPKNLRDVYKYLLIFGEDEGFAKIVVFTEKITGDVYGAEGKERFKGIVSILDKKYTRGQVFTVAGITKYNKEEEFYQCLAYEPCGLYMAEHTAEDRTINTQLIGISAGVGRVKIIVEWEPVWGDILAAQQEAKKQQEAAAL
jgi:hypothetical protein